jgi:hypothetical protein
MVIRCSCRDVFQGFSFYRGFLLGFLFWEGGGAGQGVYEEDGGHVSLAPLVERERVRLVALCYAEVLEEEQIEGAREDAARAELYNLFFGGGFQGFFFGMSSAIRRLKKSQRFS